MDWWQQVQTYGESAAESIGENITRFTDSYVDAQVQRLGEAGANPQVQKESEPTKGTAVNGTPIVVKNTAGGKVIKKPSIISGVSNEALMYAGGGIAVLALLLIAVKK
jgi:hypothetical protein